MTAVNFQDLSIKSFQSLQLESSSKSALESIATTLKSATNESNMLAKEKIYQEVYTQFHIIAKANEGKLPEEMQAPFYLFLEKCAGGIYYNQTSQDDSEGFLRSARLMEMSLGLQLSKMEFKEVTPFQWAKCDNLDALVQELIAPTNEIMLREINNIKMHSNYLVDASSKYNLRESLEATIKRMSFSHQNTSSLKDLEFHQRINDWTEALIGSETPEQKGRLADYKYNRGAFLERIKDPNNWKAQFDSYIIVIQLFNEIDPQQKERSTQAKFSQISNMQGLIGLRSKAPGSLEEAEPKFRTAFEIREKLFNSADSSQKDEEECFLANIRTGLIHCLIMNNLTQDRLKEAKMHANALMTYLEKCTEQNNLNTHQSSYLMAIQTYISGNLEFFAKQGILSQDQLQKAQWIYQKIIKGIETCQSHNEMKRYSENLTQLKMFLK